MTPLAIPGYQLHTQLYQSRRSLVWRAERLGDKRPVVLKLHRQEYPSPAEVALYQREYELLRTLDEPSIVHAEALLELHHRLVLVLEDIGGEPLSLRLQRGALEVDEFLEIASRLCASLGFLHRRRVAHNDPNPGNVILSPGGERLQLIDFGSATTLSAELPTFQNLERLEGTLAYLSPEQTGRTGRSVDHRSDLYSLGAMFYHMLTGRPPFSAPDATALAFAHLAREPEPVEALAPGTPRLLAQLVHKLLSKNPEDRYQSAWGIQADLARFQAQRRAMERVGDFPLGSEDVSDTLRFPSRLYGREREAARMLEALERVSRGGTELLAITGYSGIGKTALVRELYKPLTGHRGFFISGKFDQLRKNVPYTAVRAALKELVQQTLTTDEDKLQQWRHRLERALAGRGQVLLEMSPELELLIGPQPPVPALGPSDAQARFNQVFRAFLRAFCAAEHPLVVFLDDLQWVDHASLRLLELMLTDPELRHLLVLVAYRDNEVDDTHPFLMSLRRLEKAHVRISHLALPPLGREELVALVADTLKGEPEAVLPLVELLRRKTEGNPFFVIQFLQMMHQEELLSFDYAAHRWCWDVARIEAGSITDNVVDLMVRRLRQLPASAREILCLAACLGNRFDLSVLAVVCECSPADTFHALMPALDAGFVLPVSSLEALEEEARPSAPHVRMLRFVHDRVQQAGHALIPPSERPALHLRIGRLLLGNLSPAQQAERLFEIADHLNEGSALLSRPGEVLELVRLNLEAGKRAEAATAYASALGYLEAAVAQVDEAFWREHYEVVLELSQQHARVAYLCGDFEKAERIVHSAVEHARSALDQAELHGILLIQLTLRTRYAEAIRVGRHALGLLGITLPEDGGGLEAARDAAMIEVGRALEGKAISSLAELPRATQRETQLAMRLLSALGPPCYRWHPRLWGVVVATSARLCLQHGNVPQVSYTYPAYGGLLAFVRQDYAATREFGEVALRLSETFGQPSERSVCLLMVGGSVRHWSAPLKVASADYLEGYRVGVGSGNLQYAAYCLGHNLYCRFFQGAPVGEWSHEIATARTFAQEKRNQWTLDLADGCGLLARSLSGEEPGLDEREYIERLRESNPQPLCIYFIMKARLLLLHGDVAAAAALCEEVEPLLVRVATQGLLPWPEHRFTQALVHAALHARGDALEDCHRHLQRWAEHSPANFLHKQLLVRAELARLRGEASEALACYERAIEAARKEDFLQHAALASELAARLLQEQGREKLGLGYLYEAQHAHARWGAAWKAERLAREISALEAPGNRGAGHHLVGTTAAQLDALAVIKASQAISGQMILSQLLHTLMGFVLEHTGAERGQLLLAGEEGLSLAAEASAEGRDVHVDTPREASGAHLPLSVLNYVRRTREKVLLADASEPNPFSADAYLSSQRPRSVLCLPILRQSELVGLLYLENNLAARAFTPDRLALLEVLTAQSAISLENARLYAEVQRAEAALRHANDELEKRVEERTHELKEAQARLVDTARAAGMAEVASNVLHNVGNVLTSAILNLYQMRKAVESSRVGRAKQVSSLLEEHRGGLAEFLTRDPRGGQLPDYLRALAEELLREQATLREYLDGMGLHIEHIRAIVQVQQRYAMPALLIEECELSQLVEDALRIQLAALTRGGTDVSKQLASPCMGRVDRHKVLQILINLISNARNALEGRPKGQRHLLVRLSTDGRLARFQVVDDGMGIAPEVRARLFSHGFTTRKDGHGFGLHSSALAAQELGGRLTLESEGPGKGATATLEIPLETPLSMART